MNVVRINPQHESYCKFVRNSVPHTTMPILSIQNAFSVLDVSLMFHDGILFLSRRLKVMFLLDWVTSFTGKKFQKNKPTMFNVQNEIFNFKQSNVEQSFPPLPPYFSIGMVDPSLALNQGLTIKPHQQSNLILCLSWSKLLTSYTKFNNFINVISYYAHKLLRW